MAVARWSIRWRAVGGPALRLPDAFVQVLAAAVVLGEGAAALGVRPLSHVWGSRLFLAVLLFVGAASQRWPRVGLDHRSRGDLLCLLPAVLLTVYAVWARAALSPGMRSEWFLGGDHVRHLIFVAEEQATGNLSYVHQPYPRAWHTLLTAAWTATGGRPDPAGLASLVDLMSTATWLLPALLSIATGTFAVVLARASGLPERTAALAGVASAMAVLLPPFLSVYQALGFETSLVAAVALAVSAKLAVAPASRSSLVTCAGAVVVVAHTWQLLLPVAGLSLLAVAVRLARGRGSGLPVGAVIVVCAAAAYPGVLAVAKGVGVGHAAVSDIEAPYPLLPLLAGLMAAGVLGWRSPRGRSADLILLAVVALPAITALGIATLQKVSLDLYYPSKLLWESAVLGLAPTGVAVACLVRRLSTSNILTARTARVVVTVTVVLIAGYAAISPLGAFAGAWSTVDGPRTLSAVTSPGADRAQVVWLGSRGDDTIGRILLDFYRAGETSERVPQEPLSVADECRLLRAATRPTVLTDRPAGEALRRYECVPGIQVVLVR